MKADKWLVTSRSHLVTNDKWLVTSDKWQVTTPSHLGSGRRGLRGRWRPWCPPGPGGGTGWPWEESHSPCSYSGRSWTGACRCTAGWSSSRRTCRGWRAWWWPPSGPPTPATSSPWFSPSLRDNCDHSSIFLIPFSPPLNCCPSAHSALCWGPVFIVFTFSNSFLFVFISLDSGQTFLYSRSL